LLPYHVWIPDKFWQHLPPDTHRQHAKSDVYPENNNEALPIFHMKSRLEMKMNPKYTFLICPNMDNSGIFVLDRRN
jgi:hypothetical protein